MHHAAHTLAFGLSNHDWQSSGDMPRLLQVWRRLTAWRRPSTRVVLRRLEGYLRDDVGLAPGAVKRLPRC